MTQAFDYDKYIKQKKIDDKKQLKSCKEVLFFYKAIAEEKCRPSNVNDAFGDIDCRVASRRVEEQANYCSALTSAYYKSN